MVTILDWDTPIDVRDRDQVHFRHLHQEIGAVTITIATEAGAVQAWELRFRLTGCCCLMRAVDGIVPGPPDGTPLYLIEELAWPPPHERVRYIVRCADRTFDVTSSRCQFTRLNDSE